jgi:hypothetical protein
LSTFPLRLTVVGFRNNLEFALVTLVATGLSALTQLLESCRMWQLMIGMSSTLTVTFSGSFAARVSELLRALIFLATANSLPAPRGVQDMVLHGGSVVQTFT